MWQHMFSVPVMRTVWRRELSTGAWKACKHQQIQALVPRRHASTYKYRHWCLEGVQAPTNTGTGAWKACKHRHIQSVRGIWFAVWELLSVLKWNTFLYPKLLYSFFDQAHRTCSVTWWMYCQAVYAARCPGVHRIPITTLVTHITHSTKGVWPNFW
jgi:hypothetical protein